MNNDVLYMTGIVMHEYDVLCMTEIVPQCVTHD